MSRRRRPLARANHGVGGGAGTTWRPTTDFEERYDEEDDIPGIKAVKRRSDEHGQPASKRQQEDHSQPRQSSLPSSCGNGTRTPQSEHGEPFHFGQTQSEMSNPGWPTAKAASHRGFSFSTNQAKFGRREEKDLSGEDPDLEPLRNLQQLMSETWKAAERFHEGTQSRSSIAQRQKRLKEMEEEKHQLAQQRQTSGNRLGSRAKQPRGHPDTKVEDLSSRLQRLKEENEKQLAIKKSLQQSLTERRTRCLDHDGHFQKMGDAFSRDSLIKKYKQLYDQSDNCSQKLEDIFPSQATRIEETSPEFFNAILKATFIEAATIFEQFSECLVQLFSSSLHQQTANLARKDLEGVAGLVREWFRENTSFFPKELIVTNTLEQAEQADLHKTLLSAARASRNRQATQQAYIDVVRSFTSSCAELAWYLHVLSVPAVIAQVRVGDQFDKSTHERHSSSNIWSERISEVLWPALVTQSDSPLVLEKGKVITSDS